MGISVSSLPMALLAWGGIALFFWSIGRKRGMDKKRKTPQPETKVVKTEEVHEHQPVVFKPWLMDVTPLPLRAYDFSKGKIEGRLVMHGEQTIKRFIIIWKGNRVKTIRLEPMQVKDMEDAIKLSLAEAMAISVKVFGKKEKGGGVEAAKPAARLPTAGFRPIKPPEQTPAHLEQDTPETVISKGFIAQWKGKLLAEGIMSHVSGNNGEAASYKSYTAKLAVDGQEVCVKGNDLKRALSESGVKVGDTINLIHVRSDPLANNMRRHVYACSLLKSGSLLH